MPVVSRDKLMKHKVETDLLNKFEPEFLINLHAFPLKISDDRTLLMLAVVEKPEKNALVTLMTKTHVKKIKLFKVRAHDISYLVEKWYPTYQEAQTQEKLKKTKNNNDRFSDLKAMTGNLNDTPLSEIASQSENKKRTILLIDDDQICGRNASYILEKENWIVDLTTSDGAQHTLLMGGDYDIAIIRHNTSIDRYELEKQLKNINPKMEIRYINSYSKEWLEDVGDTDYKESYFSLTEFFTTYLEERSSTFTQGQTKKISKYVQGTAEKLGLKQKDFEKIKLAAYFFCLENLISTSDVSENRLTQSRGSVMTGSFKVISAPLDFEDILGHVSQKFKDNANGSPEDIAYLGARIIRVVSDFIYRSMDNANDDELIADFRQNSSDIYDPVVMEAFFNILKEEQTVKKPASLNKTLLIVDPDHQLSQLLKLRFLNEGFHVHRASDGREALQKISENIPDLIITEVMLPKLDGFSLMTTLQKEQATATIPVVFLSGKTDKYYINQGLNLGAIDYITKPADFDFLTTKIKRFLQVVDDRSMVSGTLMPPPYVRKETAEPVDYFLDVSIKGFEPGALIGKRYEIVSKLGQGGMGAVYKAKDRVLDEIVALKLLKEELISDDNMVDRFKYEIKLARKISHPNVIRIHDFGEIDNHYFISMEFCEGSELKDIMAEAKILDIEKTVKFFKQMLSAMSVAHSEGIIHRDLKPSNILITERDILKIVDFGLAKVQNLKGLTITGQAFGTPLYVSPEQAQGLKVDIRSDIYSLGVIFYEMLTGIPPFNAENISAILIKHLKEKPVPVRKHNPSVPEKFESMCLKSLEKKRENRYQSVDEMLAELA
jgi:DNA-binding response OmpR family regulator